MPSISCSWTPKAIKTKAGGIPTQARAWLKGEGSSEGSKQSSRDVWQSLQNMSNAQLLGNVPERWTSEQAEAYIKVKNWSREELEENLSEWYPEGVAYHQPEYWDDARFNNPAQPVVGVTWFEAGHTASGWQRRANCLSACRVRWSGKRRPRGLQGRVYPYPGDFDAARCNTFESHIRRTTPVGVFPGSETPEGAGDLSGNVWDWTSTIYDQERFPYKYKADDGREDPEAKGYRALRGGSWLTDQNDARASARYWNGPGLRNLNYGFRVACSDLKDDPDMLDS